MKSDNRPVICGLAQHTFEKPNNVSLDRPYSSSVSNDEYNINKSLTIDIWTPLLEIEKFGSTAEYPEMEQGRPC